MTQKERLSNEEKTHDRHHQPQRCMIGIGARDTPIVIDAQACKAERGETRPDQERARGNSLQALHQQQGRKARRHDQAGQQPVTVQGLRARKKQNTEQQSLPQTDCQAGREGGQREMSGGVDGLFSQLPQMNDQLIDDAHHAPARMAQHRRRLGIIGRDKIGRWIGKARIDDDGIGSVVAGWLDPQRRLRRPVELRLIYPARPFLLHPRQLPGGREAVLVVPCAWLIRGRIISYRPSSGRQ